MNNVFKGGHLFVWITGGTLAFALIMVIALVALILFNGLGFFWPKDQVEFTLRNGKVVMGEINEREVIPEPGALSGTPRKHRIQVKQGNRDLYGADFVWINESDIVKRRMPPQATVVERLEWGNFYGFIERVKNGDKTVATGPRAGFDYVEERLPEVFEVHEQIRHIEKKVIGAINHAQEGIRLDRRRLALQGTTTGPDFARFEQELGELARDYRLEERRLVDLRKSFTTIVTVADAQGEEKNIPISQVVRVYRPNLMSLTDKIIFYVSKFGEFVWDDPRESNTEGGIFPAIFGTVLLVMIMSVVVTPLGVMAGLYLGEYAKHGPLVSTVRIAVNNLAGVPSIVFGVFAVGFFIYAVGGTIDQLFFPEALPAPTFGTGGILWASLTLALLTLPVVIISTEEGLSAIPRGTREASLALGATKFETIRKVVLPGIMPSIMTGMILAIARAAGEVAPLMITGVVKLAPSLPLDGLWPFVHLERKFMHLGFHIYDVGFQSPNVDAARPMVYATTLFLLAIVLVLNLGAIAIRNRLRRRYATSAF